MNLVYGVPSEISNTSSHPIIARCRSPDHRRRQAACGDRRSPHEAGDDGTRGHAPAIVFDDADVDTASRLLATAKYRNAGQVCVSPTRMLVQERVYDQFVTGFVQHSKTLRVGDGLESSTTMGPMANPRRITAMETFIGDATQHGATVRTGGHRIGNKGNYFEPTVLTDVPKDARVMNEEPFGPLAVISPFSSFDEVVTEANRLPYGLASYAYTRSAKTANAIAAAVESGMISINHHGLALPEVPFGGVKDSGYGSEGGLEAIENYLNTKFVTQAGL
jgi:succinate-semialdehyde dehydrogenase/glutarate-semialdehyde dehydrogenase